MREKDKRSKTKKIKDIKKVNQKVSKRLTDEGLNKIIKKKRRKKIQRSEQSEESRSREP